MLAKIVGNFFMTAFEGRLGKMCSGPMGTTHDNLFKIYNSILFMIYSKYVNDGAIVKSYFCVNVVQELCDTQYFYYKYFLSNRQISYYFRTCMLDE